ncbi:FAD-dependent monooxygenase [Nocardiopsis sp. EMB25]|uniref:FAD-dependent monooxygenase n=1 Tax=Nocardiopsis sp. EMB25 TaxID=2835867 RepID=UPI002283D04B|nr:FAD-dependent monooxygenase [Nocardiopsis sp. EMB25]MCY9783901.1 FAD-dependent monooxygenase [Nocardiopsis sp. EMB25]
MTADEAARETTTDVLVVGSGPGGALLAHLLAEAGVDVLLAEKQTTLERSFRGETIAARSVLTLRDLGFEPALREHGFVEMTGIGQWERGRRVMHIDYRRFPIGAVPVDIPQPALIGAFLDAASARPNFTHLAPATLTDLVEEDGRVRGAVLRTGEGRVRVTARLVVGADGRFSKARRLSGLAADIQPMERDFLWFKLPRPDDWGHDGDLVALRDRHLVILPAFPDLLRVGYNLPKRGLADARSQGLEAFKAGITEVAPRLGPLVEEHIRSWKDTSFLEIFTARMPVWSRDGLLLVGDASHTCTPILGQGVNLALQDAVYFAPAITRALDEHPGTLPAGVFAEVEAERRAHKDMVTRFQRFQERALAQSTAAGALMRRTRLRAIDRLPFKYRLLDRVLNAPHEMTTKDRHARA